jgi:hypothetical protein
VLGKDVPRRQQDAMMTLQSQCLWQDASTTKASENAGQKRLDQTKSWSKPMSSLQTATVTHNLMSTVSQFQQVTADVKDGMAKGVVLDANMEMIQDCKKGRMQSHKHNSVRFQKSTLLEHTTLSLSQKMRAPFCFVPGSRCCFMR